MSLDFLPFSRPSIGEDEIAAVEQVLRSGWITTGPKNQELEQRFAERLGCRHAVALSSATGALHVTLLALGIGPGDEVITPSLTWVSTANVITLLGATPVFVDVDGDTLMCSAQAVEAAIGPRTRAIVPVHYAGSTLDLEGLRTVAGRHGIALVEDAAHAVGSEYRGRPVGSRGTAIFSFHAIIAFAFLLLCKNKHKIKAMMLNIVATINASLIPSTVASLFTNCSNTFIAPSCPPYCDANSRI